MALPDVIHQIAAEQNGVVSRAQLAASGVSPGLIRWHGGRHWRALLPGVLMLNTGPPSHDQRLIAALLYAGPNSWLAGVSAAQWHGLDPSPSSLPVQVYVPHPQRSRRVAWVTIRATKLGNERLVERGTLRVSCRSRALVDAAADASDERAARRLIVGEVSDRLVRIDDVQHWISVRRRNGTLRLKRAAAEAAAGSWSVSEAELARVLSRSRVLSSLCANPSLVDVLGRRLTTPDLWADDVGLAVMVHSRQFHGSELDWDATVTADEDLRASGIEVVPMTPSAIERSPGQVLLRVEEGYRRAQARPWPNLVASAKDYVRLAG